MNIKEKYKFGFDYMALIIFAVMMIPNIFWAFVSAKNDYLRIESVTPIIDIIGTVFQVIFIALLCFFVPKDKSRNKVLFILTWVCMGIYLVAWVIFYIGVGNVIPMILVMSIVPCVAFLLYEISIKNYISIIPTAAFTICHLIFAIVNFII